MATDKRPRKKAHRDEAAALAAREAKRQRNARLIGILLVVALVLGLALVTREDDEPRRLDPAAGPTGEGAEAEGAACGAEPPAEADPQQYDSPPDLTLEEGVDYRATIQTSCGPIEMDLLEDDAPKSVANFVFLAEEGYYDGLIWHRVEREAVIQTGDPDGQNGSEIDGPGYSIDDEFPESSQAYTFGAVGMANAGPGTTGSQFFIVVHDEPPFECDAKGAPLSKKEQERLDENRRFPCPAGYQPLYNVFASVDPTGGLPEDAINCTAEGESSTSYETLHRIASCPTRGGNDPVEAVKPVEPVYIDSIEITRS